MKQSKGFFLIQEVIILGLCIILLCVAIQKYTACLRLEAQSREIMDTHLLLERAAYGLEDNSLLNITYCDYNGYTVREVRKADGKQGIYVQVVQAK